MIRSIPCIAVALLSLAACETTPKSTDTGAAIAGDTGPVALGDDEPAVSPRRDPCGDRPLMMMPDDPPRQTGAVTSIE